MEKLAIESWGDFTDLAPGTNWRTVHGLVQVKIALYLGLLLTMTGPALANDTGLATTLHDIRREGGRNCFATHYHYGSSSGLSTAAAAQREAIKSWADFADLEYGSDWARYGKAAGKSVSCNQSGSGWGCDVAARPCK